jgi:hypothetical protein
MSESEQHSRPIGGIDDHVGPARMRVGEQPAVETFSRGIGRNRVALLVETDLELGQRVRFEVEVEGGTVSGAGHVERVHVQSDERWAVIDFEEVEPTGVAHLVRTLFRVRTPQPTNRPAHYTVPDKRPPREWPEPPKKTTGRKRPQVTRWEAPGATERFKRSS